MTDPRDPQNETPSSAMAASETDLAASELLEDWLVASPDSGDPHNQDAPTGRAAAMLDARNALRSREDAASPDELDRLLEGALEHLGDGPSPLAEGLAARSGPTGNVRRLDVRQRWTAAAAAAVVLIVGIGALVVQGSEFEESAQDSGISSAATEPTEVDDAESDAVSGVATTQVVPESPEQSPALEQRSDESSSADPGGFAEPSDSAGSSQADGDTTDTNEKVEPPGSIFAGVHVTGRIQLR
jgi:hypothetical protein